MKKVLLACIAGLTLFCCGSYKQNVMFKTPEGFIPGTITEELTSAVVDYTIQKNDLLTIEVFSNNGERLIDPNPELSKSSSQQGTEREKINYLITTDGHVKLPLVNDIKLEGLTITQAEELIEQEYSKYFKDPYVSIDYTNKRAILLGAAGGQVIPLTNQNMKLTEVLALGKGLDNNSKAHNIRLLRGDDVFVIDFSTIEGYRLGNMFIQPGDIIYIEPVRRPFSEALKENGSFISIIVSLASLVVIILNVK